MKVLNYIKQLLVAFYENFVKVPLRLLSHPVIGYTEFKEDKKGKLSVGIGMVLIYALLTIVRYNADGIIINKNDPTKFNSILLIIYAVMPLIILSVANWSISTLMDGKATMKQIFTMGGYSYFPLIIFGIIFVLLLGIYHLGISVLLVKNKKRRFVFSNLLFCFIFFVRSLQLRSLLPPL